MNPYQRVLLKLSGESLAGGLRHGIDEARLAEYATQIREATLMGIEVAVVIGGGNFFRGMSGADKGFDRVKADQMGMLATVMNGLALSSALNTAGVKAETLTAVRMEPIGRFYDKWHAVELLQQGYVVILTCGTGNPFFTTDSGAALRGVELEADAMLKGTRVDGVYTADPEKDPSAQRFSRISFDELYQKGLKVMDLTAATLCRDNHLPVIVFNMDAPGNLIKVLKGEEVGTVVF